MIPMITLFKRLDGAFGTEVLRPKNAVCELQACQIQACRHVGVVRLDRQTIQIVSKTCWPLDPKPEQARAAARHMLSLLGYVRGLTIREHSPATMTRQDVDWLEI